MNSRFVRQQQQELEEEENAFDENGDMTSPELSMVLEKAIVLLNGKEFSALRRILADYQTTEINIDTFAENLLQLITDQEKVVPTMCDFLDFGLTFFLHYVYSGSCTINSKAKIKVFWKFFEWSGPEGASRVKKKFQKTLILAFEVIVQLPEYT